MALVLVVALLLVVVEAQELPNTCVEYCLSLTSDETRSISNECNCADDFLKPQSAKPAHLPMGSRLPEDSSIFYQPAKKISGPGLALLQQPFYILNPAFKISFNPPEGSKRFAPYTQSSNEESSIEDDNIKVPVYLDIVVKDSIDSDRAANPQLSFYSNPLKENDLAECIDLHILLNSRDSNEAAAIKGISSRPLTLYKSLSNTEIRKEIERKCRHANNVVNDSIKEIKNKMPKKKYNAHNFNGDNDTEIESIESKHDDSGEFTRPVNSVDSPIVATTQKEFYSPSTDEPIRFPAEDDDEVLTTTTKEDIKNETFLVVSLSNTNSEEITTTTSRTEPILTSDDFKKEMWLKNMEKFAESSSTEGSMSQYETTYSTKFIDFTTTITESPKIEKVYFEDLDVIPLVNTQNKHNSTNSYLDTSVADSINSSADSSSDSEDVSKYISFEKGSTDYHKENISKMTISDNNMRLKAAQTFTAKEPIDFVSGTNSNVISTPENDAIMVNEPVNIQKIETIEFSNGTVISYAKGVETEALNNFSNYNFSDSTVLVNEPQVDNVSKTHSETDDKVENIASVITGDMYFNFNDVNIPARFIQKPDGKIHVGIDGTSLCEKLPLDTEKKHDLLAKLCSFVKDSINV